MLIVPTRWRERAPAPEGQGHARGAPRGADQSGFSLLEVLIATVLLILLSGALVLNFSAFGKGAAFDEQLRRFETLLRFARAESAQRGQPVRLTFTPREEGEGVASVPRLYGEGGLHVQVHALVVPSGDEAVEPRALDHLPWAEDDFYEVLKVESVRPLTELEAVGAAYQGQYGSDAAFGEDVDAEVAGSILFYPDGSSDSAEIVLASQDGKAPRRELLRLIGITGSIVRHRLHSEHENSMLERREDAETARPAEIGGGGSTRVGTGGEGRALRAPGVDRERSLLPQRGRTDRASRGVERARSRGQTRPGRLR